MTSKHQVFLNKHCRVCSKNLGKTQYRCVKYTMILSHFGLDPTLDNIEIHPESFCNSCYLTAKRGSETTTRVPINWPPHTEIDCFVCDQKCKGGRPKKSTSRGRPSALQQHLHSIACTIPLVNTSLLENVTCPLCCLAINKPVQISACKSLMCCSCCHNLITQKPTFSCPGCTEDHDSSIHSFSQPSRIVTNMLNEMIVQCEMCCEKVKLASIDKECNQYHRNNQNRTLEDVVNQPLETEPSKLEKQAAINLLFHQGDDDTVVTLSSGGRVRYKLFCIETN